jgi:ribosome-binding protein aMBF1 (putative translation factor)
MGSSPFLSSVQSPLLSSLLPDLRADLRAGLEFRDAKGSPPPSEKWARDGALVRDEANDVSARFGRRLRRLRQDRQMTQSDMAKKFGIDRSYISDVERGRKSMTLPMLEVIALGMSITLSKLFEDI